MRILSPVDCDKSTLIGREFNIKGFCIEMANRVINDVIPEVVCQTMKPNNLEVMENFEISKLTTEIQEFMTDVTEIRGVVVTIMSISVA